MKDDFVGGTRVEAAEVGIDLLVTGLCAKLKSLNLSLKAKGELLKILSREMIQADLNFRTIILIAVGKGARVEAEMPVMR